MTKLFKIVQIVQNCSLAKPFLKLSVTDRQYSESVTQGSEMSGQLTDRRLDQTDPTTTLCETLHVNIQLRGRPLISHFPPALLINAVPFWLFCFFCLLLWLEQISQGVVCYALIFKWFLCYGNLDGNYGGINCADGHFSGDQILFHINNQWY